MISSYSFTALEKDRSKENVILKLIIKKVALNSLSIFTLCAGNLKKDIFKLFKNLSKDL